MNRIQIDTLHAQVVHQIREMIRTGVLEKGQKIDEKYLCDSMGVSRTPVRESLRILSSEGLISLIPHRGAFVSEPCIEEINDMFEVMSVLEGMSARLAVGRMTDQDLKELDGLHEELERYYREDNPEAYLDINHTFHMFVQELSGNKALHEVAKGLRQKILLYRHQQLYQPKRFDQSIQEHRDLLASFHSRDPVLAEAHMKRHLINQGQALAGLYASKARTGNEQAAA